MTQPTISGMAGVWGLGHATAQGVDQTFALNAKAASAIASLAASAGGLPLLGGVWIAALIVCAVALFIIPESNQRDLAAIR